MLQKIAICAFSVLMTSSVTALEVGQAAPDFKLQDETGAWRTLSEFKDKRLVLFFYPKDNSPICVSQMRNLRDSYSLFEKNNIAILGISYDSIQSHKKFIERHKLPFNLLTDPKGEVVAAYGAQNGLLLNALPKRVTFVIDKNKIKQIITKINIKTHAVDILKAYNR